MQTNKKRRNKTMLATSTFVIFYLFNAFVFNVEKVLYCRIKGQYTYKLFLYLHFFLQLYQNFTE
jgi:hypothetical protein